MGASGSTGEGARLEIAESLERTFEGPGCGGTALGRAPRPLALDSPPMFRLAVLVLGLGACVAGAILRFSKMHAHESFIH